ncbi:acylphosphatase [Chitinivibrio alkaliphilus]|uniref:acylphosphatase n=1 Tax=Chitinivibrio alkaliphilus ACht1 TaxID=1313304 RepID=U7D776_9BACT|nr:acylphosphatase [Chitinivibrio alkaliphilus]ERP31416.1 acylphosphatase family protein [Chitinivibrio alkaliphilus ACht1]
MTKVMRYRFRVTGTVQGVGFRYFTEKIGRDLGLTGWVENSQDGSVVGEVQGEESRLAHFTRLLQDGPITAEVDAVVCTPCAARTNEESFQIHTS